MYIFKIRQGTLITCTMLIKILWYQMSCMVMEAKKCSESMGLRLNTNTKIIMTGSTTSLRTENKDKVVDCFCLLESTINIKRTSSQETHCRPALGRTLKALEEIFKCHEVCTLTNIRIIQTRVLPVALNGSES